MTAKELALRFVLDTNQIVGAGSRWLEIGVVGPNPHRRLLIRVVNEHKGLYCEQIIDEYLEKLIERGSPTDRARRFIAYIRGAFELVELFSIHPPVPPRDPDDEVFVLCALDGDADYLVSEDRDLLNLRAAYKRPIIARCTEVLLALGH